MTRRVPIEKIRNLGIIAHVDAGKTTLTERVLFYTGRIRAPGEVHTGNTHTDHDPIEKKKGITIKAAAVTCDWRDHRIHLIDTPGHVDFTIEVERSLRVLDGAVCVLDAVAGVEPQTETVWRQADRHGVPRLCFVNKLDRPGADFERCLTELHERLGARAVAITWPIGSEDTFTGVVDVLRMEALFWEGLDGKSYVVRDVPPELLDKVRQARNQLLEAVADADPLVLEALVEGREVSAEQARSALRAATLRGLVVPVACGSAYRNRAVQPLLDAMVDYLPSPLDRGPVRDVESGAERAPSADAALAALAFKVLFDDHGQLTFVRVYSGVLEKGMAVVTSRSGRKLRVGRIVQLMANEREDVERLEAGEIGALLGMPISGGDTLSDAEQPIVLEAIRAPEPVVRVAIEPVASSDRDRLGAALGRALAADPSLRLESDPDTGQTLLCGMGQLHLDVTVERLATEQGVQVRTGKPLVAYRTTLSRVVREETRFVKQSGGPGQFAHVVIEVGPAERGGGLRFENLVRGGAIAREYIPGVEKGVREAMERGLLGGHPVVDVRVALLDGSMHANDSSELAFKVAGAAAFKAAAEAAGPVLLEPIMLLEVTCPEEEIGSVVGDIGRRRGQVLELGVRGSVRVVRAEVPLAETFGYAGALGALTHGRGRFTMEPSRYEPVSPHTRDRISA
jgi:elongation factor G